MDSKEGGDLNASLSENEYTPACTICHDKFNGLDPLLAIPCGHVFHSTCVLKWMDISKTCPECRKNTSKEELLKLFFHFSPKYTTSNCNLLNQVNALKVKLIEKVKHIRFCEQISIRSTEIRLNLDAQLSEAKNKLHKLEQMNINLKNELEHMNRVQTIVSGCQEDVEKILSEMQTDAVVQSGQSAARRLATYCSLLKCKLTHTVKANAVMQPEIIELRSSLSKTTSMLRRSDTIKDHVESVLRFHKKVCPMAIKDGKENPVCSNDGFERRFLPNGLAPPNARIPWNCSIFGPHECWPMKSPVTPQSVDLNQKVEDVVLFDKVGKPSCPPFHGVVPDGTKRIFTAEFKHKWAERFDSVSRTPYYGSVEHGNPLNISLSSSVSVSNKRPKYCFSKMSKQDDIQKLH